MRLNYIKMPLTVGEDLPIYESVIYKNYNDIWFHSVGTNIYINILENKFCENMIGVHHHTVILDAYGLYYKGIKSDMSILKSYLTVVENKRKISLLYAEVAKSLLLEELK